MFSRTKLILIVALVVLLLPYGLTPVSAGGQGTFKALYFPHATPQTCGIDAKHGGWYVAFTSWDESQWVKVSRPGIAKYKLTDGTKKVVLEGEQNIFAIADSRVAGTRIGNFGLPNIDWGNAKNPIRAVVTIDGDQVADLTANNPCLPMAKPQPVVFDPADVKVKKEPTDRLVLRCLRDTLYISGTDDKNRTLQLTTVKLKDILATGAEGLKKDLKLNGILMIKSAGNGNFTIAWTGGRYKADGLPASGFAKTFTCTFK